MSRGTIAAIASTFAVGVLLAGAGAASAAEYKYTGVDDCAKCHKKELMGDQLAAWKESPHAKAFETLKGAEAKKVAQEKGLSTPPHEAAECLRCHATAHGIAKSEVARKPLELSDGVQCESCHGPGSEYRKKKVMSDHDKAVAAGMWEPGKDEKICTACHNAESPTWDPAKGFDFAARKEEISHPIPEEVKGRYLEAEKAARKERRSGGS